jgi:hypothetical protein
LVIGPQKTLLLKSPGSREVSICGGRPERHRYGLSCRGTASSNPAPSSKQSVSRWISPSCVEKPAEAACARARPGGRASRDAQGSSTSRQLPVTSLSGPFPVQQCRLGRSPAVVAVVR